MKKQFKSIFEATEKSQYEGQISAWEPFGPPKAPTDSMPGTWERVYEYRRRLEVGRDLYHEDDRKEQNG